LVRLGPNLCAGSLNESGFIRIETEFERKVNSGLVSKDYPRFIPLLKAIERGMESERTVV
jgi:hypothetical protein